MVHHRDEQVRLTDLVPIGQFELRGQVFENCDLYGPVVVVVGDGSVVEGCTFETGDMGAILWEIEPTRKGVSGALLLTDCQIRGCRIFHVGFAGPEKFILRFKMGTS